MKRWGERAPGSVPSEAPLESGSLDAESPASRLSESQDRSPRGVRGKYGRRSSLSRNLVSATRISNRIHSLEARCAPLEKALDRVSLGIILVHGVDEVVFVNASARSTLDARDGLLVRHNGLAASTDEGDSELRRLLCSATISPGGTFKSRSGGAMFVRRAAPKRPLSLLVAPLAYSRDAALHSGAAAVFVGDPDRAIETAPGILQSGYGLTPAESRLAGLLTQGKSLPMAARELAISNHTARSQTKSIFEKTGVGRQSELVLLFLRGPALLHL